MINLWKHPISRSDSYHWFDPGNSFNPHRSTSQLQWPGWKHRGQRARGRNVPIHLGPKHWIRQLQSLTFLEKTHPNKQPLVDCSELFFFQLGSSHGASSIFDFSEAKEYPESHKVLQFVQVWFLYNDSHQFIGTNQRCVTDCVPHNMSSSIYTLTVRTVYLFLWLFFEPSTVLIYTYMISYSILILFQKKATGFNPFQSILPVQKHWCQQAVLQTVIKEKPENPYDYMARCRPQHKNWGLKPPVGQLEFCSNVWFLNKICLEPKLNKNLFVEAL